MHIIRPYLAVCLLATCPQPVTAQHENTRLQISELRSLPDRTAELQMQLDRNGGNLTFQGDASIRITKPLLIDLVKHGAIAIRSTGGTTIVMDGPGPAIRLVGSHQGTASPRSFEPKTWNERMPIIAGIEILGAHPEADGIELAQTVEAIIDGVSVRWCRHGIRLVNRNRNTIITSCHLYECSGVGIYCDDVNLHQINVSGSHISYNREGGIVVRDGNVRNLQVVGCDIEGNMPDDTTPTSTANILIDVSGSAGDRTRSIAEIAITGCTIQHAANRSGANDQTIAPGGANIRLAGKASYPINSVAITGNVISDTTVNLEIDHAHDVTVTGNTFFAPKPANFRAMNSQRIVLSGNTFNPRQFTRPGTIEFQNCSDCLITTSTIHQFATTSGAIILDRCQGFTLSALSLTDCGSGILLRNSKNTTIANCRISRTTASSFDVSVDDSNQDILLSGNAFAGSVALLPAALTSPP